MTTEGPSPSGGPWVPRKKRREAREERLRRIAGRLFNWKFCQAEELCAIRRGRIIPDPERASLRALAAAFGDCGHFGGDLGEVVRLAVWRLIEQIDPAEYRRLTAEVGEPS